MCVYFLGKSGESVKDRRLEEMLDKIQKEGEEIDKDMLVSLVYALQ